MELDLVQESWQELKSYINPMDRPEAAEGLVSVLIENGVTPEEIRSAFSFDTDIVSALSVYIDDDQLDDDIEDDFYQDPDEL